MKYYNGMPEKQFLDYVVSYCDKERSLFRKDQVAQMYELAGYTKEAEQIDKGIKQWYSIDMSDLVAEVRSKTSLKIFGKIINLNT